jgi:hypothetical protein
MRMTAERAEAREPTAEDEGREHLRRYALRLSRDPAFRQRTRELEERLSSVGRHRGVPDGEHPARHRSRPGEQSS